MIRLLQTLCFGGIALAVAACSESAATAPEATSASAPRDLVAAAAPLPETSCTVTQVDATHYTATATWKHLAVTELQFFDGSTLLADATFDHPKRVGSLTVTVTSVPTVVQITGTTIGLRTVCTPPA